MPELMEIEEEKMLAHDGPNDDEKKRKMKHTHKYPTNRTKRWHTHTHTTSIHSLSNTECEPAALHIAKMLVVRKMRKRRE